MSGAGGRNRWALLANCISKIRPQFRERTRDILHVLRQRVHLMIGALPIANRVQFGGTVEAAGLVLVVAHSQMSRAAAGVHAAYTLPPAHVNGRVSRRE